MNWTIKRKVQMLLWASLTGIIILAIFILIANYTERIVGQHVTNINNLVIAAKDINKTMNHARQFDETFVNAPSDTNKKTVASDIKTIQDSLKQFRTNKQLNQNDIDQLNQGITRYDQSFQTFTTIKQQIGYTSQDGLLNALQGTEANLQNFVNAHNANMSLLMGYNNLRIATDTFLANPNQLTYSGITSETASLGNLAKLVLKPSDLKTYNSLMFDYRSKVDTLNTKFTLSKQLLTEFNRDANEVKTSVNKIVNQLNTMRANVYKNQSQIQSILLILMILLSLLSIGGLFLFGRRLIKSIVNSIEVLKKGAEKMGQGHLNIRVPLVGNDELTDLAKTFNQMAENMGSTIQKVTQATETLSYSSQNLAAISEETTAQSVEVNEAIQQVAAGAQTQAEHLEVGMQLIQEVTTAINQTAWLSDEIDTQSHNTQEMSQQGLQVVKGLQNTSDEFLKITKLLVTDIQEVAKQSEEITTILKIIQDLSRNTDLLALNAAIESARAGEAGKGFAIVSQEIRLLAERSKKETSNIQKVIQQIIKRLMTLSKETDKLNSFTSLQENSVKETQQAFSGIAGNVTAITDKVSSIQSAISNVTKTTHSLTNKLEEISAISEETAASTEQVSASSDSQTEAIEQVNLAAINLQDIAVQLEEEIVKFALDDEEALLTPKYDSELERSNSDKPGAPTLTDQVAAAHSDTLSERREDRQEHTSNEEHDTSEEGRS